MTSELKPCPFCKKAKFIKIKAYYEPSMGENDGFVAVCDASSRGIGYDKGCGASSGWGQTEGCAATVWNTRAVPDALELETVGYAYMNEDGDLEYAHSTRSEARKISLVLRNQAAAVIAVKDAEIAVKDAEIAGLKDCAKGLFDDRAFNRERAEAAEAKLAQTPPVPVTPDDEPAYYALTDSDWSFDDRDEGRATIVLADSPEEAVRKATDIEIAEQGEGVGIHWKVAKLTLVGFQGVEWGNSKTNLRSVPTFYHPNQQRSRGAKIMKKTLSEFMAKLRLNARYGVAATSTLHVSGDPLKADSAERERIKALFTEPPVPGDIPKSSMSETGEATNHMPIIQDWVLGLPTIQQCELLQAIRMADTAAQDDPFRIIMRHYRAAVLNGGKIGRALNKGEKGDLYMTAHLFGVDTETIMRRIWCTDRLTIGAPAAFLDLPLHFRDHFIDAAEIVADHHPCRSVRYFFDLIVRQLNSAYRYNHGERHPTGEYAIMEHSTHSTSHIMIFAPNGKIYFTANRTDENISVVRDMCDALNFRLEKQRAEI